MSEVGVSMQNGDTGPNGTERLAMAKTNARPANAQGLGVGRKNPFPLTEANGNG